MSKRHPVPTYEQQVALEKIRDSASEHIIGIDEVGLGPIAGPVTVAAVVLPKNWWAREVKDSKQLKPRPREEADKLVRKEALCFCILSGTNEEIDREGIRAVHHRLTEAAALYCLEHFPKALIVQDGDVPVVIGGRPQNMVWLPKADILVPAVSAASCVAKVYRDQFMLTMARKYTMYDFQKNMGYASPKHLAGLQKYGPCPIHRMSFKRVRQP